MHTFVLILHVIGTGVFIGIVVFSFLLSLKKPITQESLRIFQTMARLGPVAAVLQILTGIYLFFQDPGEFKESVLFWVKMAIFVISGLIALLIVDRRVKRALAEQGGQVTHVGNLSFWTFVNLVFILTIVALGVIIAKQH